MSGHHVRTGGNGRHGADSAVEFSPATQRGCGGGTEQEAGQQGDGDNSSRLRINFHHTKHKLY